MRAFFFALLGIAVASCGTGNHATNQALGGQTVDNAALTKLSLTSGSFQDGQAIPVQFTCDGANHSPALAWGEPPQDTKSFALVVDDPDAPSGIFRHWGAFDIPAATRSIPEGKAIGSQAINDFGKSGYGGPCPPPGHGPHHYRFKLFALDVPRLGIEPSANIGDVEREAEKHVVGRGDLTGTYERR